MGSTAYKTLNQIDTNSKLSSFHSKLSQTYPPFRFGCRLSTAVVAMSLSAASTKVISLKAAVDSIQKYVAAMTTFTDAEAASTLQREELAKCVDLIATCKLHNATAHDDAVAAVAVLNAEDAPWSEDNKRIIVNAIRTKVEGMTAKSHENAQQDHHCIQHYFPAWLWEVMGSHCNMDSAFEHMSTYAVTVLKLRHPSEKTRRDMVALLLAARDMSDLSDDDAQMHIDKMRRHFETARSLHPGVRGPATYPSDVDAFVHSCGDSMSSKDRPIKCKVSAHKLQMAISSLRCRRPKQSKNPIERVKPEREAKTESASAAAPSSGGLKVEAPEQRVAKPVDVLAKYVAGDLNEVDVDGLLAAHSASKPRVHQSVSIKAESMHSLDESMHSLDAGGSPEPASDKGDELGPAAVIGNLEELRRMTAAKFTKHGVTLDLDGRAAVAAAPLKRPAAAGPPAAGPPAAAPAAVAPSAAATLKRPAAAAPPAAAVAPPLNSAGKPLPKGWTVESRVIAAGRVYKMWTSPAGKKFKSLSSVEAVVKKK